MASRVPERHRPRARHSAPQFVIVMKIDRSSSLSLAIPAPQFVTPAKAGVQRGGERGLYPWGSSPAIDKPAPAPLRHSRENGNPRTIAVTAKRQSRKARNTSEKQMCSVGASATDPPFCQGERVAMELVMPKSSRSPAPRPDRTLEAA